MTTKSTHSESFGEEKGNGGGGGTLEEGADDSGHEPALLGLVVAQHALDGHLAHLISHLVLSLLLGQSLLVDVADDRL